MKIHQLANGAHFEYEGQAYVKTGPLYAVGKDGPRLIPKYAVLKPLDNATTSGSHTDLVSKRTVISAFDTFFAECTDSLPEDRRSQLDAGRARFLKAID